MTPNQVSQHPGNNLDLLRLFFASLVLLSHTPELIDGNRGRELLSILTGGAMSFGEFAVDGFFALSGYLIVASWVRNPRLGSFFKNRVLRIYPGFIVAFLISVLIVGPIGAGGHSYFQKLSFTRTLFSVLTLREPWFAHSFFERANTDVNGALWTISYEFVCYIAVAIIGYAAGRHLRMIWFILSAFLLVGTCFVPELRPLPQINRFFVADLVRMSCIFFCGGSLYLLKFKGFKSSRSDVVVFVLFAITLLSIRFNSVGFAVFGSVFFLSIGLGHPKIRLTRNWPDISYGTYLYGWPVIQLINWFFPDSEPWMVFPVVLMLSLACGYLSWKLVEARFMSFKIRTGGGLIPVA
jgi:peptidoglycan/LPS O-acetylase OafA/YrhL